jgi:cytoskeletal protein RodZ
MQVPGCITMKNFMLVILMMFCINAFAESYKWVDENNRVHYSDEPPPSSAKSKQLVSTSKAKSSAETSDSTDSSNATEPSESGEPKTIAEHEAELRKKQKADKEAAVKAAQSKANKEANKENCTQAQLTLNALQADMRIMEVDAKGEHVYLDDEQRQQRIEKTKKDISRLCK